MPRITDERRALRRSQILDAARACLQEKGLEAVSMETIVARSGLSTGAVYGYFRGKEEIINAAVTEGTEELGRELLPILQGTEPGPLSELVEKVLGTVVGFALREEGLDRLAVSVHGWSHSLSDAELGQATRRSYLRLREAFAEAVRLRREAGSIGPDVEPEAMGELLTSLTLGFVAQRALAGSAELSSHVAALEALSHPAGRQAG